MEHIKEATELVSKIKTALRAMNFDRNEYAESEVIFRMESIRGMLIIALNDAVSMLLGRD